MEVSMEETERNNSENIAAAVETAGKLHAALSSVIRGRSDTITLVLTALFADGHVLLEDYPGSGKTLLTKTLGRLIKEDASESNVPEGVIPFRRIQFTPDMLPGDVLGVNIFEPKSGTFHFVRGPVFAHIVLADELNRTGPKVQAAFLECMAEKQVTIDNTTHKLDQLFFVVGTQNPLDLAGTYPLPLVQLDRFLLRIPMSYVDAQTEVEILDHHEEIINRAEAIQPVTTRSSILHAQEVTRQVHVSKEIQQTIVDIVQDTRRASLFQFGASTRAALMVQQALRGHAIVNGKSFADEDDLKTILPHVLLHRLRFQGGIKNTIEALQEFLAPHLERLIRRK